jgi:hypothetical protein
VRTKIGYLFESSGFLLSAILFWESELCPMLCLYEEFVFDEELLYLAMSKSGLPVEIVSFDYVSL